MWVSENFGPVSKSWKCLGLKVSFLGDFSSWSLQFWNQGLAVSQSLEFAILHVWWQIQTFRLQEGPGHPDPDPDPEHKNFVQDSCTFTYTTSNANKNYSENNVEMLKLNGEQKININNVDVEWWKQCCWWFFFSFTIGMILTIPEFMVMSEWLVLQWILLRTWR